MKGCDDVLARLDELLADPGCDAELAAHLASCERCAELAGRVRATEEGGNVIHEVKASAALKGRLKGMLRLPQACERAVELAGQALDSEISSDGRSELLGHIHECAPCRATWEALATLREVGSQVKVTPHLMAKLHLHPSQHIATYRRPRRAFDLRLATAAAYLLVALTVALVGNPATVARASSDRLEKASVYTRAAVENRFDAYTRRALKGLDDAQDRTVARAQKIWKDIKSLFASDHENPKASSDVVQGSKGERS
jgi:hypothetical protein